MEFIIGAGISLLVEYLKKSIGTNPWGTRLAVLVISIVGGLAYHFLRDTVLWKTLLEILTAAGAFHNFVIRSVNESDSK